MPLPATRVIHPRFRPHHQVTVAGTMGATVRLSHPGGLGVRDPITGITGRQEATVYYEGPARVQALGGAQPADSPAGREITTGPYLIAVPADLDGHTPLLGDLVQVLSHCDPVLAGALAGLTVLVIETPQASVAFQTNLVCDRQQRTLPGG